MKLKEGEEFKWSKMHDDAFKTIKKYLTQPLVLMPPIDGKPVKLYLAVTQDSIGILLAQDNEDGKEQAIYYLSRFLNS